MGTQPLMSVAERYVTRQSGRSGGPSGLADVLDVLLDKGLVIDAFVRVSLVGIELLTVDARIVVAGVDTYLHFAEAVNRLDLLQVNPGQTLGEMVSGGASSSGAGARHQDGHRNGNAQALASGRSGDGHRQDGDEGNRDRGSAR